MAKKNLGVNVIAALPQLIRGMITTPESFKLLPADFASANALKTKLQDSIVANTGVRIYFWPAFSMFENISEEAVYEDTPLAYLPVRDGNYRFRGGIKNGMAQHRAMFTHRANNGRVFFIDVENQLLGTKDVDGNLQGFSLQVLHTEKLMLSDGSISSKSPILIALANNKEMDQNGEVIGSDIAFVINNLARLTDVTVKVVSAAAGSVVVSVKTTADDTPVNGLVLADFNVTTTAGAAQVITGATETGDGVYTLTKVSFVSGFVDLVSAATLSVKAYESTGKATITIA